MKRNILLVCVCMVLASPAFGASRDVSRKAPLFEGPASPAAGLLLIELPEISRPGHHEVQARYRLAGEEYFTEVIRFDVPDMDAVPTVELLAWFPERRAAFFQQSLVAVADVTLILDGGQSLVFDLSELRAETARLQEYGFWAMDTKAEAVSPTLDLQKVTGASCTQSGCYDDCYWYYDRCVEQQCGVNPAEDCLARCEAELSSCASFCAVCPTYTQWVEEEILSNTYTGNTVCLWWLGSGHVHQEYYTSKKLTTYRRTKDCCGSSSTEVVNVQYWQGYCYLPNNNYTCAPAGPPAACIAGL